MQSEKSKLSSFENKKTVSVTKCFICNQMFYSQSTFDLHMQHHSSKLSKNVPQEIQRKTMESFKINESDTNKSFASKTTKGVASHRASSIRNKPKQIESLANKTATSIITNPDIQTKRLCSSKPSLQNKDINQKTQVKKQKVMKEKTNKNSKQFEEAMRESSLILHKIEEITKQIQWNEPEPCIIDGSDHESEEEELQKISEQQFIGKLLAANSDYQKLQILDSIQSVEFKENQALTNYQQQYRYLKQLQSLFSVQDKRIDMQKINQIKEKIIIAIQKILMPQTNKQSVKSRDMGTCEQIENVEVAYCNECYERIEYGEECYQYQNQVKVHKQCHISD